jgi:perosamine synthetase
MIVKRNKSLHPKDIVKISEILNNESLSSFNAGPGSSFYGGENVRMLEKEFCKYFKCNYAVSVNSWTSGLEIAIESLQLKKKTEVICSPWSMSATVSAIVKNNCIPVFADVDPSTFNIDPEKVKSKITANTGAILITEMYGQSCDIEPIIKIAKKHNLYTISDTAQAIGSKVKNKYTGTLTDIGGFSFNWHKHLNCGEGGMVITDNNKLAKRMMLARNHGEGLNGDFGHNFRMTEICASLIRDQLPRLKNRIKERNSVVQRLESRVFNGNIKFPKLSDGNTHAYCTLPILIDNKKLRDNIHKKLSQLYPVRKTFSRGPLHLLKACRPFYQKMPNAELLPKKLLDFDMNYKYHHRDIDIIADLLNNTV